MDAKEHQQMKNYNLFALQGDTQTNDYDVCETLGLDPKLAGTPEINEAAIKKMHRENYNSYVASGMDPNAALKQADVLANDARARVRQAMKQ
jgi:hypothetical protein